MKPYILPFSFLRRGSAATLLALLAIVTAYSQDGTVITLEARGHGPVEKTTKVDNVPGPAVDSTAIQVTIPEGTEGKKHRVNAKGEIPVEISAEKPIVVTFMARSPDKNKVLVMVHSAGNPDRVKAILDVPLTPEWKEYKVKGDKPEAFVDFMMGASPGVVEISNVVVTQ